MNKFALFLILLAFLIVAGVVFYLTQPLRWLALKHDTVRKDDLMKLAVALDKYYADHGKYPYYDEQKYIMISGTLEIPWGEAFNPYLSVVPKDEKPRRYVYWSDKENGYQSYRIYTSLEVPSADLQACGTLDSECPSVPGKNLCGENLPCNYGVSSPNTTP